MRRSCRRATSMPAGRRRAAPSSRTDRCSCPGRRRREAFLARQRVACVEVDHRAQRSLVQFGRRGLVDDDRVEQLGSEDVEVESAVAVRRRTVMAGRDRLQPVHAYARELCAQAAHGDAAAFTAVALDRDAGNALERLGEVLVGEFGDVLGDDGIDRGDRFAFHIERGVERGAEARDDDFLGLFGGGIGGLRILCLSCGSDNKNGCGGEQPRRPAA
jgi:hypothetical protein